MRRMFAGSHNQQRNEGSSSTGASNDNASALPALLSNVDLAALLLAQVSKEALRPMRASCRAGRAAVDGWVTKLSPPPFDAADVAAGSGWWGEPATQRWGLLARCPSVRELNLCSRVLNPEDPGPLQRVAWPPALERLNLSGHCVFDALLPLAAAPHPVLASLDLSHNRLLQPALYPSMLPRLASAYPALVELRLAGSNLQDDSAAALAACEPLTRRLRLLDLRDNLLSPAALPPLADAAWPELRELLVYGNHLGDGAAELLSRTDSSACSSGGRRPLLQKLDIAPAEINPGRPNRVESAEALVQFMEHSVLILSDQHAFYVRVSACVDRGWLPEQQRISGHVIEDVRQYQQGAEEALAEARDTLADARADAERGVQRNEQQQL